MPNLPDHVPCVDCRAPATRTLFFDFQPVCDDCRPRSTRSRYAPQDPTEFMWRAVHRARGGRGAGRDLSTECDAALQASLGVTLDQARTILALTEAPRA